MKLSKEYENLLKKSIPSVKKRAKIRSYIHHLIKDIERAKTLMKDFEWTNNYLLAIDTKNYSWYKWENEIKIKTEKLSEIICNLRKLELQKNEIKEKLKKYLSV